MIVMAMQQISKFCIHMIHIVLSLQSFKNVHLYVPHFTILNIKKITYIYISIVYKLLCVHETAF